MKLFRFAPMVPATVFLLLTQGFAQPTAPAPAQKILRHLELRKMGSPDGYELQCSFPESELLFKQLRILQVDRPVTPGMIDEDIEMNLKAFLKERGFLQAEVTWEEIPISDRLMGVRIHVAPGVQYRLSSLEFKEVKAFSLKDIADQFPLRPGDVVNFRAIKEGLEKVKGMYAEKGYINWSYIPEQNFNLKAESVDFAFTFVEDIPHRVGLVAFPGCGEQAEEDRLRDLLPLRPGEVFKPSDLKASLTALNKLGSYQEVREEDSDVIPVEGKPGWVSIVIRLKPRS